MEKNYDLQSGKRIWELASEYEIRQELRRELHGKEIGVDLAPYDPMISTTLLTGARVLLK